MENPKHLALQNWRDLETSCVKGQDFAKEEKQPQEHSVGSETQLKSSEQTGAQRTQKSLVETSSMTAGFQVLMWAGTAQCPGRPAHSMDLCLQLSGENA